MKWQYAQFNQVMCIALDIECERTAPTAAAIRQAWQVVQAQPARALTSALHTVACMRTHLKIAASPGWLIHGSSAMPHCSRRHKYGFIMPLAYPRPVSALVADISEHRKLTHQPPTTNHNLSYSTQDRPPYCPTRRQVGVCQPGTSPSTHRPLAPASDSRG